MNEPIKYALLAGGAYLLYKHFVPATVATAAVVTPSTSVPVTMPANYVPVKTGDVTTAKKDSAMSVDQMNQLVVLNGNSRNASADVWNYYYSQLTGRLQTTDLFDPSLARDTPMPVEQYFSARVMHGLSGYSGRAGYPQRIWA